MANFIKLTITTIMFVVLFCCTTVYSQDFVKLLDAVDKIELNLKELIKKESSERTKAIKALKNQLKNSYNLSENSPNLAILVDSLQGQLRTIRHEIELYIQSQPTTYLSQQNFLDIIEDIEFLKAENAYMRSLTDNNNLLVSLNGGESDVIDANRTQSLENKLDVLNHQVQKLQQSQAPNRLTLPIKFNGFVDASNYTDGNSGESSFGLDQVEMDISKEFSNRASLRADIEYVSDGLGNFDMDLEQGFITYSVGTTKPWSFNFGKFNAPIGFELLDAPDMYQYSHALVFDLGLPTNLTGLMISTNFSPKVDWTFYLVNGWDVNSDNNKEKTIGTRLGFTPKENLNFGFSLISGAELDDNNSSRRTVVDWDLKYNPKPSWTIGWEFNYGNETKVLTDNTSGTWDGFLLMNNFAFSDNFGLTGRFDYFNDKDGIRTGTPQTIKAIAISPSLVIVDGLAGLFEFRYDFSNKDVWIDSNGILKDNNFTTALEFTYGF